MVEKFLSTHFKLPKIKDELSDVVIVGKEDHKFFLVTVKSFDFNREILKQKSLCLKNLPFYVDPDRTPLEHEIGWRARTHARSIGHTAKAINDKVLIGKEWHVWDQLSGNFVKEQPDPKRKRDRTSRPGSNVSKQGNAGQNMV